MRPATTTYNTERLTRKQKEADNFKWYREKMDSYDTGGTFLASGYGGVSEYRRMKVNYDLFNNKIDLEEFNHVCTPFGADQGEMPARLVNRDISAYRIKAMIGMEMKRPFGYSILATNREATTRKETKETDMMREFVLSGIMGPIQQETEIKYQEDLRGKLSPQEREQINQAIAQEIKAKTPPEVKQYMLRDHQDPSEVQGQQITNYLVKKEDIRNKFNLGWKHVMLSAYEIYLLTIIRKEPVLKAVNPMRFTCDKSSDLLYIEDGAWACAEYRMHPSEVSAMFEFTDKELDEIYAYNHVTAQDSFLQSMFSNEEDLEGGLRDNPEDIGKIVVRHFNFKGQRKIGWLKYLDNDGVLQQRMLVDESYQLNKENGDIDLEWEWINESYEGYKINGSIYKGMQPVIGQAIDEHNLYNCKLSYYGAIYDNTNSEPTSPMDRMKTLQYLYNIIVFRIELLTASDKGKKLLMNINGVPSESGIDLKKWQYFFESTPFAWYNPDEEGMNQSDVNTVAKVLDMSLASDIDKYIQLAEYIEQKCGKVIGVTDPVLGETPASERVGNNQQNLVQTSYMLEPYFNLHNSVKRNVMQGLLDLAKVAYAESDQEYLSYILDDMSKEMFKLDKALLKSSTLGLFMEDSSLAEELKQTIGSLAQAAMQNQKIELSDVFKVLRQDSIQEAEEALLISEQTRTEKEQGIEAQKQEFQAAEAQKARDHEKETWANTSSDIVLKEEQRRITEVQKQAILSVGFNENKDSDNDGRLDAFEIAQEGMKANILASKEARENRALEHKIANDKEVNTINKQKNSSSGTNK